MPFEYREHTGESWIVASGNSLAEAFEEGAKALFNLMVPLEQVECVETRSAGCSAESLDRLFFEWLNALILLKDIEGLILCKFAILSIESQNSEYKLTAEVSGELFDAAKHEGHVDVKAATYSELKCEKSHSGYEVGCVLDI